MGAYTVTVDADGFATERHSHIVLTIGEAQQLNIALRVASDRQQVNVVDAPPTVKPVQRAGLGAGE